MIWVDDLLLFADSVQTMNKIKSDIQNEWETTDMGEPTKIVGIEITLSKGRISISQKQSIKKILTRQGLDTVSPVLMPLNPNVKLVSNPDGNQGDRSNSFTQLLGELQYIVNSTRPDIAFAVNPLASYMANLSMQHIMAAKRILRYLSGTCEYVLRPLGRQDNEDLDRLIVAADTGLLRLTCLLFDSEWFWDSLLDSWTDYLMSPFEDYPLNLDAQ